jgi:hypothetical protein
MLRSLAFAFVFVSTLSAADTYAWWADPCTPELARSTSCQSGDAQLAQWAFEAWQRESNGALKFTKAESPERAHIRLHWVNANSGLYGETEPILVNGKRGANIYVVPSVAGPTDPLLRDAIVYLTCVHESGHALGLSHTRSFADIMYSFAYGGDIAAYFGRYRDLLHTRSDIALHSGISDNDRTVLRALYH